MEIFDQRLAINLSFHDCGNQAVKKRIHLFHTPGITLRLFLLVRPITGRTHQIRLHMSSIGHPIIGDTMYGEESSDITRQALHAYKLTLPSPVTDESITFCAELPEDITLLIKKYGLDFTEKQ